MSVPFAEKRSRTTSRWLGSLKRINTNFLEERLWLTTLFAERAPYKW